MVLAMENVPELPEPSRLRSLDPTENERAWNEAYPILYKLGMKIANSRLAGMDHEEDRQDVVQTAIMQLNNGLMGVKRDGSASTAKSFQAVESVEHLRNLFYRIVRARIADFLRRKTDVEEEESIPPDSRREIWELVDQLKPPKPELFVARFLYGYSTDEIAEKFEMSRNTVVSHFHRGLKTLREMEVSHV